MLGFLIWFPKLYFLPQILFIIAIFYAFFFRKNIIINRLKIVHYRQAFIILVLIAFLSTLNRLLGLATVENFKDIIPPVIYPFTFLVAIAITNRDLKVLFWLLFLEVIFIYIEFLLGINTVFFWQKDFKHIDNIVYLYSFRPHGLSSGSSTMGYKLLILLILFDYLNLKGHLYTLLKILSIGALIIVFSRTPLIAYTIYLVVKFIVYFKKNIITYSFIVFILILILIYILLYTDIIHIIIEQVTLGRNNVIHYRSIIWEEQFQFIKNNILFGNHSFKYLVPLYVYGSLEHAHNSYIEILSTNGIIIFILYISFIFIYINRKNFIYILPFLILSVTQYAIFWQISLIDIVFLHILVMRKDKEYENNKFNYSKFYSR